MKRSTAREIAVRLCFMLSETSEDPEVILSDMFENDHYVTLGEEDELFSEKPGKQLEYISEVVRGVGLHNAELDEYIERYSEKWDFDRISRTALAIMKTAMYEVLYMPDVPNGVSINEAVELAKKYEEPEVVPFVNGILGAFVKGETV
ncbi:MAG: transcription antitermination factor NusB [Oscillospiraceae bacterium]|nr:transcription antitermination factor NusB [Oscillospiraceae bacterium]